MLGNRRTVRGPFRRTASGEKAVPAINISQSVSIHQYKAGIESDEYTTAPPESESQQICNVFKSSTDFCFVCSLAEQPAGSQPQDPVTSAVEALVGGVRIDTCEEGGKRSASRVKSRRRTRLLVQLPQIAWQDVVLSAQAPPA